MDPLTEKQEKLVIILEVSRIDGFVHAPLRGFRGCPEKDRRNVARAFVAKAVYDLPTTRTLIDQLRSSANLRRICGWERASEVPSESTFSRAFAEFAASDLPQLVQAAMIGEHVSPRVIAHISRDSTAIEAREKPLKKPSKAQEKKEKKKRGRPMKGEERYKPVPRLEHQAAGQCLEDMLKDLPQACDRGCKKNSKGYKETWNGYKLHIDVGDGQIPISCILTSASVHDSQVAIPLAEMTKGRADSLYDLMDAAYDCKEIREHSMSLGHVPLIDVNPRRDKELKSELKNEAKRQKLLNFEYPEGIRYRERNSAERVNGRLKDEFGGRHVRVRGAAKVMAHLMFGILALTADQLLRLVV
ncbi:MAG: transposase [Proteobacteria bacterium]|nr:transposase [Pseudomonadota bacterium]